MKEFPKKQPPPASGGFGTIPCTDIPYVPGKTPVVDEPFPPTLPGPDQSPTCDPTF
jgi:hypothetical protein